MHRVMEHFGHCGLVYGQIPRFTEDISSITINPYYSELATQTYPQNYYTGLALF